MPKFLRYLLIIIGILVIAAGCFAAFIAIRGIPHYTAEKITVKVEPTPARLERGKVLVSLLCKNCHMDEKTNKLTGRELAEVPQFGQVFSKNITNDPVYGIGKWTDGEIIYLLRTGLKPDGTYLPPYMAKVPHMSDEDVYSVISFLRSDNPWVAADKTVHPPTSPSFLTKFLCSMGIVKPFPYPKSVIPPPDTTNAVELGRYVAFNFECFSCHSEDFKTNDFLNPEKSKGFFGGGNSFKMQDGTVVQSLNLTPDEETGIGKWTEDEFVTAVKSGILPGGQHALRNPPMTPYAGLTDKEVKAVYVYLRSVPKIKNKVERNIVDK